MMDHGRFGYSAIVDRPPLHWPNGAYVAIMVIPNIEHFRFDSTFPGGLPTPPDVLAYAPRDYGNRVGVWRLMDVLDRYEVRATVALNAEIGDFEPRIIQEGNRRGWEWMGHGLTNSRRLSGLTPDEERGVITATINKIETASGQRMRGWLGPGLAETMHTLDFLKEAGLDWVGEWTNDDQPYMMETKHGPLCSLSYCDELDDKHVYEPAAKSPDEFRGMIQDHFDTLYREGAASGRVMSIAIHPYLSGLPHRIKYLDQALAYIDRHDHIWWATGSEIVDAYQTQLAPADNKPA